MKKRCIEIKKEFDEMIGSVKNKEDEILEDCMARNNIINKKYSFVENEAEIDQRIKITKRVAMNLKEKELKDPKMRNILRTHSKKVKKRGRKKKNISSSSKKNDVYSNTANFDDSKENNNISFNASPNGFVNLSDIKGSNLFQEFHKFNHPSAFSSSKYLNNLMTPEKINIYNSSNKQVEKIEKSNLQFNPVPFASTYDKSKR